MEASLTATNVHVSNHIPYDIILSILSKLPLKSFKRFECVHKSWSLLFDDLYFMTMYITNFLSNDCSYNEDTCLLIDYKYTIHLGPSVIIHDLYSLSSENFDNIVKLDWPKPFREDGDGYDFESWVRQILIALFVSVLSTVLIGHLYSGTQLLMNSRSFLPALLSMNVLCTWMFITVII
jgi:hypothetical protein